MVRGEGSISMPSWVMVSSQPAAVPVSAVVPVLVQDIEVTREERPSAAPRPERRPG